MPKRRWPIPFRIGPRPEILEWATARVLGRATVSTVKARSACVMRLIEEAKRLILEARRPRKRGELVRLLERDGLPVEGTDKAKVLGTNLWRSGQLKQIEGQEYWPKDLPRPHA